MKTIFWFRNDLRLTNNETLHFALKSASELILLYILEEETSYHIGKAQEWWLHHSLSELSFEIKKIGGKLILRRGHTQSLLQKLVKEHHIDAIFWNRVYEPKLLEFDKKLIQLLRKQKILVKTFNTYLLTDPSEIFNQSGKVYKVYTPYAKAIQHKIISHATLPKITSFPKLIRVLSENLDDWKLLPKKTSWAKKFSIWKPGELGAQKALNQFIKNNLKNYDSKRDQLGISFTSQLSPHVHFGELSTHQIWSTIKKIEISDPQLSKSAFSYLRQLLWREFSYYLLFHFPKLPKENFRSEFNAFRWNQNEEYLKSWQRGCTGYPIVDAGMRQLWETGYMHNRVRMIAASFLTKNLLIDWRKGAFWFWNTLLDADLANNSVGWQWIAGCGPDSAPYCRIFNPILQEKKFDPHGEYIRRWTQNKEVEPIICHKTSRAEALLRYKEIRA